MKKLLSLPPNLVGCFHQITEFDEKEWFCTHDPIHQKLGSGGGSAWLLWQCYEQERNHQDGTTPFSSEGTFTDWLSREKRLLLHAGGQSRRLPAYAPSGKILTPIPVFRWERGQRLSQDLLSLQTPLYERILKAAPDHLHTMIVSGDVYIRSTEPLGEIPDADVVCYGLWLGSEIARDHGVFVSSRQSPNELKYMLQKPSVDTLGALLKDHFYLTDIGIWLLSDRAVEVLMRKSTQSISNLQPQTFNLYDLYSDFGCCLGTHPTINDPEVRELKVAILPLPGGEFYHYGTSHELISSTLAVQNLVNDQRRIMHHDRKPHPSMFIQNSIVNVPITGENQQLWIENSFIGRKWKLSHHHIITGVPENDWELTLNPGDCIDVVPIGESQWVVRRYRFDDKFAGEEQTRKQFPVVEDLHEQPQKENHMLLSAEEISAQANLVRLTAQRQRFRAQNWQALAENHAHSVFYQVDLEDAAHEFAEQGIAEPSPLSETEPIALLTRIHDAMFRSQLYREKEGTVSPKSVEWGRKAFSLLRAGLTGQVLSEQPVPRLSVYEDQIVWGRSPVRIDLAGGWTDTPPYCLMEGGNVLNIAIELNGQPPLQAYIKPCKETHIILRSIDLGAVEVVQTHDQLMDFHHVGSPFSIPKAALVLAGFGGDDLPSVLRSFGCGIEVTLLSAVPAGSGLGTSSLLASTVLGVLNDFCGLTWDKNEIGWRTLVLEQMLTTGGGWQDQFGGLLQGVKLLQTSRGFEQTPSVRWLPSELFTQPEYKPCHLLYYTGITRTAKTILAEIVRRMFLNQHTELGQLREMKAHALEMYEAIQRNDFTAMGQLVRKTWIQNQAIDAGTNPQEIRVLTDLIDDLCLGYKLPGAGGGGYLYMIAKDPEAAARVKQVLHQANRHPNARFVDMTLSEKGLQVSRS